MKTCVAVVLLLLGCCIGSLAVQSAEQVALEPAHAELESLGFFLQESEEGSLGHEVKERSEFESEKNQNFVDTSLTFKKAGQLTSWTVDATGEGYLKVGVFRETERMEDGSRKYKLVGENIVDVVKGVQTIPIEAAKQISFEAGDVVGWRFESMQAEISYDKEGVDNMVATTATTDCLAVGDVVRTAGEAVDRTYAIRANYKYFAHIKVKDRNANKLGHVLRERANTDAQAVHTSFVDTNLHLDGGLIDAWNALATGEGTVRFQVWRPFGSNQFILVGENVVLVHAGMGHYAVPEHERIKALPGDVAGFRYDGEAGLLSFDEGGMGKVMWTAEGADAIAVGLNATFPHEAVRTYSFQVDYTPAASVIDATASFVAGAGAERAVAGVNSTFTIQGVDIVGRPQHFGGQSFEVALRGPENATGIVFDKADGTYAVWYRVERAGTYTASVVCTSDDQRVPLLDTPITIEVVPAASAAALTTAYGDELHVCEQDWWCGFELQGHDAFNNACPLATQHAVSVRTKGALAMDLAVKPTEDGKWTVVIPSAVLGDYEVHVDVDGHAIVGSPFRLHIRPDYTDAAKSFLAPYRVVAGEANVVTLQSVNRKGERRVRGGDAYAVDITGPGALEFAVRDLSNGKYNLTIDTTQAGAYNMTIALDGKTIQDMPGTLLVQPAIIDPTNCVLRGDGLKDATAGVLTNLTVLARDRFGNAYSSGGAAWEATMTGPTQRDGEGKLVSEGDAIERFQVEDLENGYYVVHYYTTVNGEYLLKLRVRGSDVVKTVPITVFADYPIFPATYAQGRGLTQGFRDLRNDFVIQPVDRYGNKIARPGVGRFTGSLDGPRPTKHIEINANPDGTFGGSYSTNTTGAYTLRIFFDGEEFPTSPYAITVEDDVTVTAKSSVDGEVGARAGTPAQFNIVSRNVTGGRRYRGGDVYTVAISGAHEEDVTPVDNNDGTYTVTYTDTVVGDVKLDIKDADGMPIKGSPFHVAIEPAKLSEKHTTASGDDLHFNTAGNLGFVTVHGADAWENAAIKGGDDVSAVLEGPTKGVPAVKDHGDGSYTVRYVAHTAGEYKLHVRVRGKDIVGSPFELTVIPDVSVAANTAVTGLPDFAWEGEPLRVAIQPRNKTFANRTGGDDTVDVHVYAKDESHKEVKTVKTSVDDMGLFTSAFAVPRQGVYAVDVRLNGATVKGSPFTLTVKEAFTLAQGSHIVDADKKLPVPRPTFTVQAMSDHGHPRMYGGDAFVCTLKCAGADARTLKGVDNDDGTYTFAWDTTKTGACSAEISLENIHIMGSPVPLDVIAGPTSPQALHAEGFVKVDGVQMVVDANEKQVIEITSKDNWNNVRTTGGEAITASIDGVASSGAVDKKNGVYALTFATTKAQRLDVNVFLNGEAVYGSPFKVWTRPAATSVPNTVVPDYRKNVHLNYVNHYTVHTFDAFNNAGAGKDTVTAQLVRPEGSTDAKVVNKGEGKYEVQFTPTKATTYELAVQVNGKPVPNSPFPVEAHPADGKPVFNTLYSGAMLAEHVQEAADAAPAALLSDKEEAAKEVEEKAPEWEGSLDLKATASMEKLLEVEVLPSATLMEGIDYTVKMQVALGKGSNAIVGLSDGERIVAFARHNKAGAVPPKAWGDIVTAPKVSYIGDELVQYPAAEGAWSEAAWFDLYVHFDGEDTEVVVAGEANVAPAAQRLPANEGLNKFRPLSLVVFAGAVPESATEENAAQRTVSVHSVNVEVYEDGFAHFFFTGAHIYAHGAEMDGPREKSLTKIPSKLNIGASAEQFHEKLFSLPLTTLRAGHQYTASVRVFEQVEAGAESRPIFGLSDGTTFVGFQRGDASVARAGYAIAGKNGNLLANTVEKEGGAISTTPFVSDFQLEFYPGKTVIVATSAATAAPAVLVGPALNLTRPLQLVAFANHAAERYALYGVEVELRPNGYFERSGIAHFFASAGDLVNEDAAHKAALSGVRSHELTDGQLHFAAGSQESELLARVPLRMPLDKSKSYSVRVEAVLSHADASVDDNVVLGVSDGKTVLGVQRGNKLASSEDTTVAGWSLTGEDAGDKVDNVELRAGGETSHNTFHRFGFTVKLLSATEGDNTVMRPAIYPRVDTTAEPGVLAVATPFGVALPGAPRTLDLVLFANHATTAYTVSSVEALVMEEGF